MSLVAEFTVDAEEFLLGRTVADFPDLTVEVERVVPAGKRVMPYLWVHGSGIGRFEQDLRADENVHSLAVLDRLTEAALFKVTWERPAERFITGLVESNATILEARGSTAWTFRVRFEDRDGLAAFHQFCAAHGINEHLERVQPLAVEADRSSTYGLTRPQYETLRKALDCGYFKVPREVTFAELATELDISEQAVSERVRRGTHAVLRETLPEVTFDPQE